MDSRTDFRTLEPTAPRVDSNETNLVQSIFDSIAEIRPDGQRFLRGRNLVNLLSRSGIQRNDIRLASSFDALEQLGSSGAELNLTDFSKVISSSEVCSKQLKNWLTID